MLIFLLYFVMSVVAAVSALFISEYDNNVCSFDSPDYVFVTFIGLMWPLSLPLFFFLLIVQVSYKLIKKLTNKEI